MRQYEASCVLDAQAIVGEGPAWDAELGRLTWVDIPSWQLHRFDPATGENESWKLPAEGGFAVPTTDGNLICGTRDGLWQFDHASGEFTKVADDPEAGLASRFNDGKCDRAGRLWAGTISDARDPECALYRIEPDLSIEKVLGAVTNSNGLAWSADDLTLYYIDSPLRRVDAFDFAPGTGTLANRRTAFEVSESFGGKPDGMTIDVEGNLWIAIFGGGLITHWNAKTGEQLGEVRTPCEKITSCCFGGSNLDQLYITTARVGLSDEQLAAQPLAGGLFMARPGVAGLPTYRFGG